MIGWRSTQAHAAFCEVVGDYSARRGAWGPLKLIAKSARMAWHWRGQRDFLRSIGGPVTRQLVTTRPRMALRPHAQYLFQRTGLDLRMRLLIAHYDFLNRFYDAARFAQIIAERGVALWSIDSNGRSLAIRLLGPPHHHEGDLALKFLIDDEVIFQMAFSIVPFDGFGLPSADVASRSCCAIYIGQVQGVSGQASLIRQATQLCDAIAPQDLLMSALAGIAAAWGIASLLGVAADRHLSIDKMRAAPQAFDYTLFWARYHSMISSEGHHVIDVPFLQKPIGEIVSRHRKRTLIKRRFKEALVDQVATTMANSARSIR